ncbi:MAG: hypothetical protein IPJ81_10515 [Chitinophagaceae bacterium]|nr:hypothetical protein [Chitinophagaceae bacterium]
MINGKWEVVSIQIKTVTNGDIENESYIGKPSDFVNFKDDNTVQSSVDEIGETVLYKILPDNKVSIDNEIFDIKTLTTNTCILYSKTVIDNNNSEEQTISLKNNLYLLRRLPSFAVYIC